MAALKTGAAFVVGAMCGALITRRRLHFDDHHHHEDRRCRFSSRRQAPQKDAAGSIPEEKENMAPLPIADDVNNRSRLLIGNEKPLRMD